MSSTHRPVILMLVSVALLLAPGVGDIRWFGLIVLIYIGIPWYIVALKDKVEHKQTFEQQPKSRFRVYSFTLLVFGIVSAVVGVAIDLFILYQIYTNPGTASISSGLMRLFIGIPFFGFGAYLIFLSIGQANSET